MSKWQPIETAPKNKNLLVWMDAYERHSGVDWKRYGHAFMVIRDEGLDPYRLKIAIENIMGVAPPDGGYVQVELRVLEPTHWMPLPEPPEEDL